MKRIFGLCVVAAALAGTPVSTVDSAAAEALPTLFAGGWRTSYPPLSGSGALTLQAAEPAAGIAALEAVGGPSTGCSAPTVYYTGSYTTGSDYGKVAGCTTDLSGLALTAYYKSEPKERHGNFAVSTTCAEPNSFSGTYNELSEGGSSGNYVGTRTSGTQSCPTSGGGGTSVAGGSSGAVTVLAPPPSWGQSSASTTLAANQSAVIPSPQLGRTQRTATVTAPLDEATAIALVAKNGPRKPGDCIYAALGATNGFVSEPTTSHESEREEEEHRDAEDLRQLLLPQIFKATFVQCLGLLAQAPSAKGATAAASRCHTSAALVIKVRHKGKLLRRVGRDRKPPLTISCSIAPAGLRVHLATNGGRVLRSVVGPRLLVGLHRSRTATGSATVSASFSTH